MCGDKKITKADFCVVIKKSRSIFCVREKIITNMKTDGFSIFCRNMEIYDFGENLSEYHESNNDFFWWLSGLNNTIFIKHYLYIFAISIESDKNCEKFC